MSISKGSLNVSNITYGSRQVLAVYKGREMIWSPSGWEFIQVRIANGDSVASSNAAICYDSSSDFIISDRTSYYTETQEPIYLAHNRATNKYYITVAEGHTGPIFWNGDRITTNIGTTTTPVSFADAQEVTLDASQLSETPTQIEITAVGASSSEENYDGKILYYSGNLFGFDFSVGSVPYVSIQTLYELRSSSSLQNCVLRVNTVEQDLIKGVPGQSFTVSVEPAEGYQWKTIPTTVDINGTAVTLTESTVAAGRYQCSVVLNEPVVMAHFDTGEIEEELQDITINLTNLAGMKPTFTSYCIIRQGEATSGSYLISKEIKETAQDTVTVSAPRDTKYTIDIYYLTSSLDKREYTVDWIINGVKSTIISPKTITVNSDTTVINCNVNCIGTGMDMRCTIDFDGTQVEEEAE